VNEEIKADLKSVELDSHTSMSYLSEALKEDVYDYPKEFEVKEIEVQKFDEKEFILNSIFDEIMNEV